MGRKKSTHHCGIRKHREIRAALMRRGETLTSWARRRGFSVNSAHAAVAGRRSGPRSREILAAVESDINS